MRKVHIFIIASLLLLFAPAICYAQMTDNDVMEYANKALAQGKNQSEIVRTLLQKGVTQEQAQRLKDKLQGGKISTSTEQAINGAVVGRKSHSEVVNSGLESSVDEFGNIKVDYQLSGNLDTSTVVIFGHDIFNSKALTFEPNENAATPDNYKLGPGDQLTIQLWGDNEATITQTVTPEGSIFISQIGRIQLNGMTIKAAQTKIGNLLKSRYANIDGGGTSVSVTLSQIRTILVNVMGDVEVPGTYRLSSFATVFNALYRAGGVTDNGSMRAVKVVRGSQEIASVDVYGYLLDGKSESDIALRDGDIIIVPTYQNLVKIEGQVKRPMYYEMKEGETLDKLFEYSGGFTGNAYRDDFCIIRNSGFEKTVSTVNMKDADSFMLNDGDAVTVSSSLDRFSNKIEARGCIFRPGVYELGNEIATVRQLVRKAGGLTEDAFPSRAIILREKDDLSLETVAIDIKSVVDGKSDDVLLKKNDVLIVSSIHELIDKGNLTINGYVAEPGEFPYADNTTVEDLILQAGGLLDGASMARVDIARRVNDPIATNATEALGESFSFAIKDGFVVDGGEDFILKPYDVVMVRLSPTYAEQRFVSVHGEVSFPGDYALINRDERLSDIIKRAGGLTPFAYIPGARILRANDTENGYMNTSINNIINRGSAKDSINVNSLTQSKYIVSANLAKAMSSPRSTSDIVLQEGDIVYIPELVNTIRVEGEVMFPTAVAYDKNSSVRSYVNMAGGFTQRAKRSHIYIVYADGHAERANSSFARVEPGSVIIVPTKKDRDKMSSSEILSLTSASTSLVTILTMLINLINPL